MRSFMHDTVSLLVDRGVSLLPRFSANTPPQYRPGEFVPHVTAWPALGCLVALRREIRSGVVRQKCFDG